MLNTELLTPKDISERLRLRSTTVYRIIKEEIPFLRIGRTIRVKPEDFDTWLKQHEHGTPITLDFDAMQADLDASTQKQEDAEDMALFDARINEPTIPLEDVLAERERLKRTA